MQRENESSNQEWLELLQLAIVDIFRHFRSIIMVGLVCAIVADVFFTLRYQPLYRSEATFALKTNNEYTTTSTVDEIGEIANAFSYIISSNIFKEKIMEDMKLTSLNGYYETSVLENTNIIKISAVSIEPKSAYLMMKSMINRYQEISKLVLGEINIELMKDISIPTQPFNTLNHKNNLVIFGGIGIIGSIFLFGLLSYFSTTVKLKEDIEKLQLPLLGSIPREAKCYRSRTKIIRKKNILINQMSTSFRYIESVKKIRYKIEERNYQVIMVTSSLENEGKTSVIANLALALKANHKKVLLIDSDLRKPAIYKIFDLENNDGMAQILSGNTEFSSIVTHSNNGIDFILGKTSYEDASERVESKYFRDCIEQAREEYDYILIDSVPSAMFSDSTSLAQMCDGYIMVVRQNFVVEKMLEDIVDKLSLSQVPLIGCVLNSKLESPLHKTKITRNPYGYPYGYGYGYHRKNEDGEKYE